jgi:uncharacterized membrane protein
VFASLLPGVQHLQNIHPLVIHFPVALLTGAVLLYFAAHFGGRESWAWTSLLLLLLGAVSAAAAVASGLYAEPGVMVARSVRAHLLEPHKRLMLATLAMSIAACVWALAARPMPLKGRWVFLVLLLTMLAMMVKGADYGGRLVYDYNAGGSACGQPIDFNR